jgi:DNA-binding NarL/FixJ family response regulator
VGEGAVTVLVVDDHPIVRRGLAALLIGERWVREVVEAATVREAQASAVTTRPDVALLDLGLPDGDGMSLIPHLRRVVPRCALLVLTMTKDDEVVGAALAAGTNGYVLKDSAPEVILGAIRTVLDGGLVLGPDVPVSALHGARRTTVPPPLDRLTPTELRILGMVGRGARNGEIAAALGISEKTVRNRLTSVLAAIGATDRVQAALTARDAGLHRLPDPEP